MIKKPARLRMEQAGGSRSNGESPNVFVQLGFFLAFRSNVKVHSSTGTKSGNLQETGAENWTTAKKWKTKEKKEVRDEKKTRQNQLRHKKKKVQHPPRLLSLKAMTYSCHGDALLCGIWQNTVV